MAIGKATKCGLFPPVLERSKMQSRRVYQNSTPVQTRSLLVEDQMNKIELAVAEEIVVDAVEVPTELSLSELDMIGGGAFGVLLM